MKGRVIFSFVALSLALFVGSAYASDYPTKPITLQVPYPAGGSTDVGARIVAAIAEKQIGQPIVVVNKAGAGGQVGWTELARQKPDGYYLGYINLPHLPATILDPERKATFKGEDIVPIISQALDPTTISVRPDSPWATLKDLIEDAKKKPGQIAAGIVGYLQDDEIGYLQFAEAAGVKLRLVYFDGAAPAITALLGKHVDVLFCTVADNYSQWKSGRIRMLTIMDKERTKFYPDLATTAELGFPMVISASTRGIAGPKGIPEPIMKKLQDVFKKTMMAKEHMDKLEGAAHPVKIMVGEEFVKYYWDSFKVAQKWVDYVRKK
ncbi:MAG: tripartite tricarboxylate transporter substrate binding protein [Thermodesulfobacteriota bacterium]|nr:tripartite tricarboxylate transporter substrate binding protein [Thermodesulfobacteriota bacterium]